MSYKDFKIILSNVFKHKNIEIINIKYVEKLIIVHRCIYDKRIFLIEVYLGIYLNNNGSVLIQNWRLVLFYFYDQ